MPEMPVANAVWIDLDLTDLPLDARPHTPEDVDAMAADLTDAGQIQNITVLRKGDPASPAGGRYEVIAGARRTLAAKKLGWRQIKAEVRENLTEFERIDLMYSENDGRIEANPLFQSKLLDRMLKAEPGMTQVALAKKKGKSETEISQYLSLLDLPKEVIAIFTIVKITEWSLRCLRRLSDDSQQIQIAQDVRDGKLRPEDIEKVVKKLLKEPNKAQKEPKNPETAPKGGFFFKVKGDMTSVKGKFLNNSDVNETIAQFREAIVQWKVKNPVTDKAAATAETASIAGMAETPQ